MTDELTPKIIRGSAFHDDRGSICFNNVLPLSSYKRMYIINNSLELPFRGWHGHEFESKIFVTILGKIRFGAVRVRDWSKPDPLEQVISAEIGSESMDAFFVPGGYANGILSLEPGSQALVLSSSSLNDSLQDDYRIDSNYWVL